MNAIEAGKAYIKFLLEDKEFKKKLDGIGTRLQNVGKIGMTATAPIVGAFAAATAAALSYGDGVGDMAARTGIAADKLSALQYAADQSDVSVGTLERGIQRMTLNIGNAINGTGTFSETLNTLGLSVSELQGLAPDQQFLRISDAIAQVEDPALRAALAQKTFGKASQELGPLLAIGSDGMGAMMQKAHELGVVLTEEDVTALGELDQALKTAKTQLFGMSVQVGAAVAGPLTDFLGILQPIASAVVYLIDLCPNLVRVLAAVSTAIAAASAATWGLGLAIKFATAHPVIAALSVIAAAVASIASYFWDAADGTAALGNNINEIGGGAGPPADVKAIEAQAAALAAQTQESMAQIAIQPPTSTTSVFDPQLMDVLADSNKGIWEVVNILTRIERRPGGLIAGAG